MLGAQLGRPPAAGADAEPVFLFDRSFDLATREIDEEESKESTAASRRRNSAAGLAGDLQQAEDLEDDEGLQAGDEWAHFLAAFRAVVWMTYRRGFRPMKPPSAFTSDSGWGCMLRSAQMMLAEMLVRHLGSDDYGRARPASNAHRNMLRWFIDAPKYFAFYSIHRMTECGRQFGKKPGEWYGPNTVALVLRELVSSHSNRVSEKSSSGGPRVQPSFLDRDYHSLRSISSQQGVSVYISDDGTVYLEEVRRLCEKAVPATESPKSAKPPDGASKPAPKESVPSLDDPMLHPRRAPQWATALFMIIPVRLGLHTINSDYIAPLIETLKLPQCVGMIGGRPAHSLYFIGSQGKNLLYLDPHTVQVAASEQECDDEFFPYQDTVNTYHCESPRVIPATAIDPSLAVGFYVRSPEELSDLVARLGQFHTIGLPFLSVAETRPSYDDLGDSDEDGDSHDPFGSPVRGARGAPANAQEQQQQQQQQQSPLPKHGRADASADGTGNSRSQSETAGQDEDDDNDEGMETASEGSGDEFVFL